MFKIHLHHHHGPDAPGMRAEHAKEGRQATWCRKLISISSRGVNFLAVKAVCGKCKRVQLSQLALIPAGDQPF